MCADWAYCSWFTAGFALVDPRVAFANTVAIVSGFSLPSFLLLFHGGILLCVVLKTDSPLFLLAFRLRLIARLVGLIVVVLEERLRIFFLLNNRL